MLAAQCVVVSTGDLDPARKSLVSPQDAEKQMTTRQSYWGYDRGNSVLGEASYLARHPGKASQKR